MIRTCVRRPGVTDSVSCCVIAAAMAGTGALLAWSVGNPIGAPIGATGVDHLLAPVVGIAGWLCWGWLVIAVAVEAATVLPGSGGLLAASAARRVSPTVVRRAVQTLLGLSLAVGPLVAAPAMAAGPIGPPSPVTSAAGPATSPAVRLALPGVVPYLDLDRAAVTTPVSAGTTSIGSLDRSGGLAYVAPPPPLLHAAPVRTNTALTPLVSGPATRDNHDGGYAVHRGDTLWAIAARHLGPNASATEVARAWPRWYAANRSAIGGNPDLLLPGEVLYPPSA